MNTNIIINLAVTLVACGSVYYLLRKRINNVDNKVSVLMQLVKEHHAQAQQQAAIIMRESHDNHSQNLHQGHGNMEMEMSNLDDVIGQLIDSGWTEAPDCAPGEGVNYTGRFQL